MLTPSLPDLSREELPPWLWPRAAYVHIPFCAHHCCYCDFAVAARADQHVDAYLDALEAELSRLDEPQPMRTLFIGGGTPTHLALAQLARLFRMLQRWLPLDGEGEFSIEANPANLDPDKIELLAGHGINRLSLGAQSFLPGMLQVLERDHDAGAIARAVDLGRKHIGNVSLDLIFGVPGQTLADWQQDLDTALGLGVDHVATYGLTYETGTRLWKQRQQGQVKPVDEDLELAMYQEALDRLETAGFEHYEISNFARPGRRCRHNEVYWANHAYFGFGMGAARYVMGVREINVRDLAGYLRRARAGEALTSQSEQLSPPDRAAETACVQLRRREGIDRTAFHQQTGYSVDDVLGRLPQLVAQKLLEDSGTNIQLTRRGKCLADWVETELLRSEPPA